MFQGKATGSMHSHDRTLIAKLGFADEDRLNPRHDLACRYLVTTEIARELVLRFAPPPKLQSRIINSERYETFHDEVKWRVNIKSSLEVPLSKGQGQYATTLGFLDVVFDYSYEKLCIGQRVESVDYNYETRRHIPKIVDFERWDKTPKESLLIEVKSQPISASEILRQINFYRSYCWPATWIVATLFDIDSSSAESLTNQKITPLRLGDKFEKWCHEIKASPPAKLEEI